MTDAEKFMDAIHQAGYHIISREDWYRWQADQARLQKLEKVAVYAKSYRTELQKQRINESAGEFLMRRNLDDALDELEATERG